MVVELKVNIEVGTFVLVPIPKLLVVLFQKKLALSCAIVVPLENKTEPEVKVGNVNLVAT